MSNFWTWVFTTFGIPKSFTTAPTPPTEEEPGDPGDPGDPEHINKILLCAAGGLILALALKPKRRS